MRYLVPFILLITVFGCKTKENKATYFGGKILHPKSNNVILFDFEKAIDTIYLKDDNTFLGKIDSLKEGLFYFKHGPEHQYIYLEPQDSLLLRLNTWDFDESLVYSGTSAAKNNTLIESFLQNEKEEKLFYNLVKEKPEDYIEKVNELIASKDKKIANYKTLHPEVSERFLKILEISHKYPIYTQIEDYIIEKESSKDTVKLSSKFFKHRNEVYMGLDSIMFFNAYSEYVMTRIYSNTYQQGHKKNTDEFTVALLKNIDANIKTEELKNVYLRHATIRHFYNKSSCTLNKDAFYTFFKLSSNIEDKKQIQRLLNDAKNLNKGDRLPDFNTISYAGVVENSNHLIKNKNCVLYFRNPSHYSDEWVAKRINFLNNNNPKTSFIIINVTDNKNYSIKDIDISKQYYLSTESAAKQFLTSNYPRTILVNNKGIIVNGFGALSSQKINQQIANLEKKQ